MRSVVHYSQETDSYRVGRAAINDVLNRLGTTPDLLLLFASVAHDLQALVQGVRSLASGISLCGCTGAGIITMQGSDEATHSIALMGLSAPSLRIATFIYPNLAADPEDVGAKIAKCVEREILQGMRNRLLFLFADGLTINADGLYRGMKANLHSHIDVVGGAAGNDYQEDSTYQFCNEQVRRDAVCGVLIQGDFSYQVGVTHGSTPVGLFRTITRAHGNMIYEIDNTPALDILRRFIGDERVKDVGQTLNLFELGEEFPGQGYSENILNRAIIGIDERHGGIRLAVEIPEGAKVRITRRDRDLVLARTREMASEMADKFRSFGEATLFYFNCSGRGSYLFGDPEQDIDALRSALSPSQEMIGFFTFGEFAPINSVNYYHNYTGVLVGIEE